MKHFFQTYKSILSLSAGLMLLCVTLFYSCKKNPDYNIHKENKLVVLAEITAGDSAYIPIAMSQVAGDGNPINFEKITNASVVITDESGATRTLQFNNAADFNSNPASIYSHPAIFKYNTGYTLKIDHPQLGTVTATTHIPSPFTVNNVVTDETDLRGREVFDFSFNINDAAGEKNYYIFEAVKQLAHVFKYFYWNGVQYDYDTATGKDLYEELDDDYDIPLHEDTVATNKYLRLNVYTSDTNTGNATIGKLDSAFSSIFITDSLFNGQIYSAKFSIAMNHFESISPQDKGIILVRIKSVDKSFYDYMLQYEKYKMDFGAMPVGQLNSPAGNIQNGLGIFGGVSKKEWKFYYDEL